VALFASVLFYPPLYFWAKGRLSVDEEKWYKFHRKSDQAIEYRRAALGMLLYPVTYSFIVLPLSVARWDNSASSAATFFGVTMFNLSGAINVFLFLTLKPDLLLFSRRDELEGPDHRPDVELVPQSPNSPGGSPFLPDEAKLQPSPQPSTSALADEDSKSAALSRAGSRLTPNPGPY